METPVVIYAFFNPVAAIVSFPVGALSDRVGRKLPPLASFLGAAAAHLGFGVSHNLLIIATLFVL